MFSLICVWINGWINNREAGNLRRYRAHSDVIVMIPPSAGPLPSLPTTQIRKALSKMKCSKSAGPSGIGQYSEEFGSGIGVHQGSVLNPLLFILVMDVLSHEFRTGVAWELLYADYLVLIADTQEGYIAKLKAWKAGMESKGPWFNMKKTKFLVSGYDQDVLQKSDKYPCAVCCRRNTISFTTTETWRWEHHISPSLSATQMAWPCTTGHVLSQIYHKLSDPRH